MISLSPLSTSHPLAFQRQWVRSSGACYGTFNLLMDRSLGFGSIPCNYDALLRLGFPTAPLTVNLATEYKSLTHYTKGTRSPRKVAPTACTHTVSGSISLPSQGFFSPFPHGTGSLSVSQEYLALEDGPPIFKQDFSCPALLNMLSLEFKIQDYHLLWSAFPRCSSILKIIGFSPFARRYLGNLN